MSNTLKLLVARLRKSCVILLCLTSHLQILSKMLTRVFFEVENLQKCAMKRMYNFIFSVLTLGIELASLQRTANSLNVPDDFEQILLIFHP